MNFQKLVILSLRLESKAEMRVVVLFCSSMSRCSLPSCFIVMLIFAYFILAFTVFSVFCR